MRAPMFKYLMPALLLSAAALPTLGQSTSNPPPQPDQYCIINAYPQDKDRAEMTLLGGSASPANVNQSQQTAEAQQVKRFAYEVDALNYMSSHGWELVSTTTIIGGRYASTTGVRYYLRRRGN